MSHFVSQCFASLVVYSLTVRGGPKNGGSPSHQRFQYSNGPMIYLDDLGVPPWPTTLLPWAAPAKPLPWLQASAAATGNFWSLGDTTGSFGGSKKAERVFPHHLPGDVEAFVIDVFNSFQNGSSFLHVRSLSFYGFPSILAWFSTLFWWSQRFFLARQVRSPPRGPHHGEAPRRVEGQEPGQEVYTLTDVDSEYITYI